MRTLISSLQAQISDLLDNIADGSAWRQSVALLLVYAIVTSTSAVAVPNVRLFQTVSTPAPWNLARGGASSERVPEANLGIAATTERNRNPVAKPIRADRLLASLQPRLAAAALLQSAAGPSTSTIQSNFNGTSIAAGGYIWFNAVVTVDGLPSGADTKLYVKGATIQFTANGSPYSISVPDAIITYSATATSATTTYDAVRKQIKTTVPLALSGNALLSAVALPVLSGLPGGINPVSWTATFYADRPGLTAKWKWAAAVYSTFSSDSNGVGVKPVDGSIANPYTNSDHAGTPENYKTFVLGGARGGGGSNYTGSYSGTASVAPNLMNFAPPLANAGPDQTVKLNTTVQLDGTLSTDPQGFLLAYQWMMTSKPAGSAAVLDFSSRATPTFVADQLGDYVIQLVVDDGQMTSPPSQVVISTHNSPPVANAGSDQSAVVGATVQLDGSKSSDVDGDALTYHWEIVSKPDTSAAVLSDASLLKPTFILDVKGTYVVSLVVSDGHATSDAAQVVVGTTNTAPIANPGLPPQAVVGSPVQLDGSGSTDVDGDPLSYQWALIGRPEGSGASLSNASEMRVSFTPDQFGTYVVQLIVNDGTTDSAPATLPLSTENRSPIADAGDPQTVALGALVSLDGTRSFDPDGQQITYSWSLLSKPAGSDAVITSETSSKPIFTCDKPGDYVAQLIVSDGQLRSSPSHVTISTANSVPIANPGDPQYVVSGSSVVLDGSRSFDADGDTLTFSWAILFQPFGGTVALSDPKSATPSFVPNVGGFYVIQLQVDDGKAKSDPKTVTVTVNQPPIVDAGPNATTNFPTYQLNGSVFDDGIPVGNTLSTTWTLLSGPGEVTFDAAGSPTTVVTFSTAGAYELRLSATDGELTSSDPVTINYIPLTPRAPAVSAGPNQTITLPNDSVTLNGSVKSTSGLTDPITASWMQVSGPTSVTFTDAASAVTQVSLFLPGVYVLRLTGAQSGLSSTSDVTIMVFSETGGVNQAPVVDAGPHQQVILPNTITLDGSAFDDGLPSGTLDVSWHKLSGPGDVTFENGSSAKTTASFNVPGDYVLELWASDGELVSTAQTKVLVGQLTGSRSNKGTDFWIMFPGNYSTPELNLFISSEVATTATVTVPGINFSKDVTVAAGSVTTVIVPATASVDSIETIEKKGIHITSLQPVAAYGLSYVSAATDGFMGLPTTVLGTEYVVAGYKNAGPVNGTQLSIVAPYDSTTVTVTPATNAQQRTTGKPYTFVMHSGRSYLLRSTLSNADVTGTIINSDKPIGVFGGHECGNINGAWCNNLVEQLPPVDTLGLHYVTMPLATRKKGDTFRIIAAVDSTHFTISNGFSGTLDRGQFYETLLADPSQIDADQPFLLVQYSNGQSFDGVTKSDPFMLVVPPYEQFGGVYTVSTATKGFPVNYINVLVPEAGKSTIQLDGAVVDSGIFIPVASSGYFGAQLPVSVGSHHLSGTTPFGAYIYGFNDYDGYGYSGGLHLGTLSNAIISLQPESASQSIGTQRCLTATAMDVNGAPLGAIGLDFLIVGSQSRSAHVETDQYGQALYCYAGTQQGVDTVTVSSGRLKSLSTVTWTADGQNQRPFVSAGNDRTTTLPSSATLSGIALDDGLPTATLDVSWSQLAGPGTVTFGSPTKAQTIATFSTPGTYVARLTANDGEVSTTSDVTITVFASDANQAAVVQPIPDQTVDFTTNPAGELTIRADAADDGLPTGSKLSYQWSYVSGPGAQDVTVWNPVEPETKLTFAKLGSKQTFVLRVTVDDSQLTSSTDVKITVLPANAAPSVSGSSQPITLPTTTATLNGTVTDDGLPAGSTLDIRWTQLTGPSVAEIATPDQRVTSVTVPAAGTYTFQLSANDGEFTSRSNVTLTVNPANRAPGISLANTYYKTTLPANTITVSATATDDGIPVGSTLTYAWTASSGPGPVNFTAADQPTTAAMFVNPGRYSLQIAVSDSQLVTTSTVTVDVAAANHAPSVSAGSNISVALPTTTATLTGKASDDGLPQGSSLTVSWTQVSGPAAVTFVSPTQQTTQASFAIEGTYVVRLTASDGELSSSSDVIVTVLAQSQNTPPVVNAGLGQTITLPSTSVYLSGTVKDDGLPAPPRLTNTWSLVSGPGPVSFGNPNATSTYAYFSVAGAYVLRLSSSDNQYTTTSDITVTVNPPLNQPPRVSVTGIPALTLPNSSATLNGSVTDDNLPQGVPLNIQWSQVSGPALVAFSNPLQAITQADFPAAGSYMLRLAASDTQYTSVYTLSVTVNQANKPPTISLPGVAAITLPANTAQFTATVTDDGLPNGSLAYTWSQVSGPAPALIATPSQASSQITFSSAGSYSFQFSANDGLLTTTTIIGFTVNPPLPPPPTLALVSPQDGAIITKPIDVIGSTSGGSWKLEYSLNSADGSPSQTWTTFATGNSIVTAAKLGTFDSTLLLNGTYTIRFTSTDSKGQTSTTKLSAVVADNMKVGVFTLSFTDLSVPVGGLPIQVIRTYDSRDKRPGDFGTGWTVGIKNVRLEKNRILGANWEETTEYTSMFPRNCLQSIGPRIVTITFPDGTQYKFQAVSNPQCSIGPITAPTLAFSQLQGSPGTAGASLVPVDGGSVLLDGAVPGPVNLVDYNTNVYNPTVFKLTTAAGYIYVIDQAVGVTRLTDPNGNTLTFNDDGIVSSTGASVLFTRDTKHRITQITDPKNNVLKYTYTDYNNELQTFTDAEKNTTTFGYYSNTYLNSITDPRNLQPVRNNYDSTGRLLSTVDSSGKTITYTHDVSNRNEQVTDRNGKITLYEYDDSGNVVRVTDPLGKVTSFTYDLNDNKLSETNALGKTTQFAYDRFGNRTSETDPLDNKTSYTYNNRHQVVTRSDALERTTTMSYDSKGNLLSTKDASGNITMYAYNSAGQTSSVTDALMGLTTFTYNSAGNLETQTDALRHITSYTYDANGNKLTQTVTRTVSDGTTESLTTTYEYDGNNRLKKTTFPDGTYTRIEYNKIGKQSATYDALNQKTSYDYDEQGRLIKTTFPDTTFESVTYDFEGRRKTITDRGNHTTTYEYDDAGRLNKTIYADGSFMETTYDDAGEVIASKDANGNVTTYGYDDAGRRTTITDALDHVTRFGYDAAGQQTSVTDARHNTITYRYDTNGRRTRVDYPDHTIELTGYDALGRMTSKTDQAGKVTQYGYDGLGRLTSVTDALNQVTSYGYDELGNRTTQTDTNNHSTLYEYDKLGRRAKRTLPLGMSESYTYDAIGNLKTKTDFNSKTTTYGYDSLNRLLSKTPDGSFGAPAITFTYTSTGKRKTMTDPSGTTTYTYEPLTDRLTSKQTPFGTLGYTYDLAGNVLSVASSNANGASMTYTYDALNRLQTVTTPGNAPTLYSYDEVGDLAGYTYPNGVSTSYTYNSLNRLTNLGSSLGGDALSSYTYTLGAAGNRLTVAELNGRTVQYGYDDLYRLKSETIANDLHGQSGTIAYVYDKVGNRKEMASTVPAVPAGLWNYDANDRITTDVYDNNGNTIADAGTQNVYDFENHLIQRGGVTIVYDGDGNRVSETVGGVTTNYLVDNENLTGYAQVMEELQGGAVVRSYTWGHWLVSATQQIDSTRRTSYYGYDGHGSVRFLTDLNGVVTDTYDYDAFGNLIHSTGTTPNNYRFAGEQFDQALGLYYNRARNLDVRSGRFWGMDTEEGKILEPLSLHKYLYASADPIDRTDPTGRFDMVESMAVASIANTINSMEFTSANAVINGVGSCSQNPGDVCDPTTGALKSLLWDAMAGTVLIAGTAIVGKVLSRASKYLPLRFSQTTASRYFSKRGDFAGETIGAVTTKLTRGELSPDAVPVKYIVRDGARLIVNTRSSLALIRAAIPEERWVLQDVTGVAEEELRMTKRLLDNGLDNLGTDIIRITGLGQNASSLE